MNTKPLIFVVEEKALWFALVAEIGCEFKLEAALCKAGCPAFCPTEIREKVASGRARRIERRIQHPQMPPYVFVMSFGGFPWKIIEGDLDVQRYYAGYLGSEEGETYVPCPIPQKEMAEMARTNGQGYNLPPERQIIKAKNSRKLKKEARRLRRLKEAA